ncbi:MAG TPA: VOC family protein [Candidatus Eremiobacteraceae bacterium]|nr:VOC family protein [Candidatus Eremiobacteraceae bacterium]
MTAPDGEHSGAAPPQITGLLESALYVEDVHRSAGFFCGVLGLTPMFESERLIALDAKRSGSLLLFQRGATLEDVETKGGTVPGHDGAGPVHMAFAIPQDSYESWINRLASFGVKIRSEVRWPRGGRSIYFDDPDGHLIELATPGLWPNY